MSGWLRQGRVEVDDRRGGRPATWDRGRWLVVLSAGLVVVLGLLAGLGLAGWYALHNVGHPTGHAAVRPGSAPAGGQVSGGVRAAEDALAARPMPVYGTDVALPHALSARDPGVLVLPRPSGTGPVGVPDGFPHTPQGAMAQLAAILTTAMQSGSLPGVRAVIGPWAAAGGPTAQSWTAVSAMAGFLSDAGLSGAGSPQLAVRFTPVMGLVKGSVGPDFVVPCVDFEMDATLAASGRIAVGACQRMVWVGGRWLIGPGAEAVDPPSAWPDTAEAIAAGYKDLRDG